MNQQIISTHVNDVPALIQRDVSLKDKNWFNTGGNAAYFAAPTTTPELQQALSFAQVNQLPLLLIGCGANMLVADEGFDGMVIIPRNVEIKHTVQDGQAVVTAGAGVQMPVLIEYCLANNIVGLEEFSGIPGTVGGSVFINIHYFEFLLSKFLISATVVDLQGNVTTVGNSWFNFGYNYSTLHQRQYILVDATFALRHVSDIEAAYAKGRSTEIIRHRVQRYPNAGTCGSFFRNFFEHEVTLVSNGKKMIYVAYYLDKIGVKGALRIGGAEVSYKHANMLVNTGTATSNDIVILARTMQKLVQDQFGILPQPECQLVGFKENPLL